MKKFSIIIVTYNSLGYIDGCLKSIRNNVTGIDYGDIEIIIVDNSDEKAFLELRKFIELNYPEIHLIQNTKNGGYGQGNNLGMQYASANIVCIANPDIVFRKLDFDEVQKRFNTNKKLALIGGKQKGGLHMSFWTRSEYEFFLITTPFTIFLNKINLYFQKIHHLSGAMLIVDQQKFQQIGCFDENMFLYREESDITRRFLEARYDTFFDPSIKYNHLIDDREGLSDAAFKEELKATKYYMQKFGKNYEFYLAQRIFYSNIMLLLNRVLGRRKRFKEFENAKQKYTDEKFNFQKEKIKL